MFEEYEQHAPKVDKVNDLGNAYEALTYSGDRPPTPVKRIGRKCYTFCLYPIF